MCGMKSAEECFLWCLYIDGSSLESCRVVYSEEIEGALNCQVF